MKRLWPHLVAAFVVFHVVAVCVETLPDLRIGLDRRAWKDARARRELQMWADRLGMQRQALEDLLYEIGVTYQGARTVVTTPFRPYMRATGMREAWAMFGAGTAQGDRFGLRMRTCAVDDATCDWQDLYLHGDETLAWRADILAHPRLRSAIFRWSWPSAKSAYHRGCMAMAFLVLRDFPDAAVVQCRFQRITLPSPKRPAPPPPEWRIEHNVDTAKLKQVLKS